MKKQRGYYNIDFTKIVVGGLVIAVVVGFALNNLLSWAWPYIKAFIHAITA